MTDLTSNAPAAANDAPLRTSPADLLVRPRIVVHETPSGNELMAALRDLLPTHRLDRREEWIFGDRGSEVVVPIWHWDAGFAAFERVAGDLLRTFVYPLVATGRPFVVSFPFPRERLLPTERDIGSVDGLDLEDIRTLLTVNGFEETFALLPQLLARTPLTPIEAQLQQAFAAAGIAAKPQVRFGRFTLDFLVEGQ